MVDQFYFNLNLELFIKWLYGNQNKYDHDITCLFEDNGQYGKTVIFKLHDLEGYINVWPNGIIEEEIYDDEKKVLFYLHYRLITLAQGQKMFYEFYDLLTKYTKTPPLKIILCCTGGLSSSFFANNLETLISLKHLNYKFIPIGFYQLEKFYHDCDAIYLAPQISYLEPQVMHLVGNNIPIHCITPNIYATYNYRGLLDMITNQKIIKKLKNGT